MFLRLSDMFTCAGNAQEVDHHPFAVNSCLVPPPEEPSDSVEYTFTQGNAPL